MILQDATTADASTIQLLGAGCFGLLIGWYVYYVNRYRKGDVSLGDLVTLIGVIGGAGILALFEARSDLFGAYGIGLALGFFLYFLILVVLVNRSANFDADWFLDGRRRRLGPEYEIPGDVRATTGAMGATTGGTEIR
ncbi:MAG TPA: hypothetical protein VFX98_04970 [Longimicrobiaceae bacterium]|nr:hypothetical protein [Longimicrobiaceae bacterium]